MSENRRVPVAVAIAALTVVALAAGCALASGDAVVLAPGNPAPDVTLKASDGKQYRLSDYHGKQAVVIAWFPKAFTGG